MNMENEIFKYRSWYSLFTTAMVHVTVNCNLECRYCFVKQEPHMMETETIYNIIDLLAKNYYEKNEMLGNVFVNNGEKCCLVFFGGEPLLGYDNIIVKGVEYANEMYPNLFEYSITTNGTLLTKEKVDFIYKNNFSIILSIDGDKETQDFNRPCKNGESSFDKLMENLPYILEKYPNLSFRSTISREKCNKLFENYLFAESLGFRNFFCVPDHLNLNWTKEEMDILGKELKKIFEYRIDQFKNNIEPMYFSKIINTYETILIHDTAVIDNTFNNLVPNWDDNCGLGISHVGINWNGDIYGCQEQTYNFDKNNDNIFLIGNIYQGGINKEKHIKLINNIKQKTKITNINPERCDNCIGKGICHFNNCISCNYYTGCTDSDTMIMNDISCFWEEEMLKNCITQMYILIEIENNKFFENYLLKHSKKYRDMAEKGE